MSKQDETVAAEQQIDALNEAELEEALRERAEAANVADHELTFWQAARKYKKAMFWACIFSFTLTMESTDLSIIPAYFGQDVFINKFGTRVNGVLEISAPWQSGLQMSGSVGEIFGLLIAGFAADRFGWKKTLCSMMLWLTAFLFLFAFPNSLTTILVGNILCGISFGAFQTGCVAYACEVVPTKLRPFVTAWVGICWGLGFFTGSWVVRVFLNLPGNWSWRVPFLTQFIWPIPLFLCYIQAPESPFFLVRKGRMEEARQTLRRLRDMSQTTEDEIELQLSLIDYTTKIEDRLRRSGTYMECFRGKSLWRTEIVIVVALCTTWGGNAINSQTVQFLEQAGLSETGAFNLNLVLNSQYLTMGLVCVWLMTKFGRATIFIVGLIISDICLLIMGVLGCFTATNAISNAIGAILVISTVAYITTVAPCSYTLIAEIPSSKLRNKTIVLSRIAFNTQGFITNTILPLMLTGGAWNIGARSAFLFVGTNTLLWIWCIFRLPETKDRTFREIDWLFEESGLSARKWKSARVDVFNDAAVEDEPQKGEVSVQHVE